MKIGEVIQQGTDQLRENLQNLSAEIVGIEAKVAPRANRDPIDRSTLNLRVRDRSDTTWQIAGIALTRAFPGELKYRLFELSSSNTENQTCYPLLIAPYLSEESAQLCRAHGVGYLDLSGNCHLNFGPFYIHVSGKPNQYKPEQSLGTLFSTKSSRVLRVLLQGPIRPHKVKELADEANVSLGLVSKVRTHLLEQLWANETPNGIRISQPDTILNQWRNVDNWSKRTTIREYSTLASEQNLAKKLIIACKQHSPKSAPIFTLNFAAWLRAPHNAPTTVSAYLESFPDEEILRKELQARPVSSGAGNLKLIVPSDYTGVTIGSTNAPYSSDFSIVSDLQLYLDLYGGERNGAEQAKVLRDLEDFNGTWTETNHLHT